MNNFVARLSARAKQSQTLINTTQNSCAKGSSWLCSCHGKHSHCSCQEKHSLFLPFHSIFCTYLLIHSTHLRGLTLGLFPLITNSSIFHIISISISIISTSILFTWPNHISLVFCIFSLEYLQVFLFSVLHS